jgi:phage-related protein
MKKVLWVSSSKRDLEELPRPVIRDFGYGLFQAQCGDHPDIAKVLRGFGNAGVLELITEEVGGTFRAVSRLKRAKELYEKWKRENDE